jgi:aminomethyltransferase
MLRDTPLLSAHTAAGAKLVPFAGWRMPLQYTSIAEEARACRTAAALFDVSHMGNLRLVGTEARAAARAVLTREVRTLPVGCSHYALLCNPAGGVRDDLIVLAESDTAIRLVVNAVNHDRDRAWLEEHLASHAVQFDEPRGRSFGLALQGPRAAEVLAAVASAGEMPAHYGTFTWMDLVGARTLVSRTGYTGEDGFELFGEAEAGPALWRALLDRGGALGLVPAGLAARDVLRQEMGYPLWGQDLGESTTPLEAGLRWAVEWEGDFIGRSALEGATPTRRRVGFTVLGPGVARAGASISVGGDEIGRVTSGTYSHHLGQAIGQGYIASTAKAGPGDEVTLSGGTRELPARLAKLPLLPARHLTSWTKLKGKTEL